MLTKPKLTSPVVGASPSERFWLVFMGWIRESISRRERQSESPFRSFCSGPSRNALQLALEAVTVGDAVRVSRAPQNIVSSPARREEDCEDFVGGSVQIVVARSVETVDHSKRVFQRRQS